MKNITSALIIFVLTCFLFEPTRCALPAYLQNLELDDITSLWDKFPSIIGKIKEAVNRFRCPKGWRRLGGSCYYLSNVTSTPSEANQTCNLLHSNHSNLMQIRNTVELFYAAHVLTKNNLTSLMIDIDPLLLKGKRIAEILMDDQGRWQRMKDKFREVRIRYYKLKEKVINELHEAGLRISRRSKKVKQSARKHKQNFIHDHMDPDVYDDYDYYKEQNMTDAYPSNSTTELDEYEYDDLDSADEGDEFEQLEDIRGICDQLDWNVISNDSTVYLLTTYLVSDKIVCSLSNVEDDTDYDHVCEYVLDFCFANIVCGKHGRCVNTLSGFKCSCSFLYGGLLCERISKQGKQILIGFLLIFILYGLSFKPVRWILFGCFKQSRDFCKYCLKAQKKRKQVKRKETKEDKRRLVPSQKSENDIQNIAKIPLSEYHVEDRRQTLAQEIMDFILPHSVGPLRNPSKRDLVRLCWVGVLSVSFLSLLFIVTTYKHFSSYRYDITDETRLDLLVNDTLRLVTRCENISDYRLGNLIFFPIASALILIFSWSIKREKRCTDLCDGRPGLIAPIEPFRTTNRFTTATVFGILAFEVLKIFEELLFSTGDPLNQGVLIEVLIRIAIVILVGLRYYPVLASLQLRNIAVRFFVCLYILGDIIYAIIREGSCMGFLPLSRYYSALEEAKLRVELGTWFIIYGLIKNTPHFILLSYIGAELWVRFAYDSIYVPLKKKQSIWLAPVAQHDESEFAKYYVKKLFRRNLPTTRTNYSTKANIDKLEDFEHENQMLKKDNDSRVRKFFRSIYQWDDDFRFTTMATCTYTVAIVFLYYLACTFVFLYISRTTGHISFVRYYIESTLNIEFKGIFSLRLEIIASAVITVCIYGFQLYIGMQNYKKHRKDLYKGIYEDVPSAANFTANSIASKSVHYSGFLVGYMAWGFVICFHLIFVILSLLRIISLQLRYIELVLTFTVPVLVVYLLKMVSTSSAGKFFFIQDMDEKLNLKNRKTYAIFVYFNFFADCFLGIASCIIRLIKATALNVVYMARLDCSFLGRPLEKFDLGFAAYVSYLHMEVTHTNPIMLAFCYSLYDDVIQRRPKRCYDDECCIAPGELDDDVHVLQERTTVKKSVQKPTRNGDKMISQKTKVNPQEYINPAEPSSKRRNSIASGNKSNDDDADEQGLSIRETKTQKKSPSPSSNSDRGSQKSKPRKPSIDHKIVEEEGEDGGPTTPEISTIARLIPQQQPVLPSLSDLPPAVPPRADLPSENEQDNDDNFDDDGGIKPPSISSISKIIPQQQPVLLPVQRSSAPRAPRRQDLAEEEYDDDDGGINPKVIAKQKNELEEKKKKKDAEKKKKQSNRAGDDDDDDDDDGGISKRERIATQKKKEELEKQKKEKEQRRVKVKQEIDDDDDDGGVSKQKQIAAQKKKQELEKKKKEKERRKVETKQDNDEDEDGAPKRHESTKKKPSKEKVSKPAFVKEDDEDDDGGRIVKTYDTVRMIMPKKQPVFDRQTIKKSSLEAVDDGSMLTSAPVQEPSLTSCYTVGQIVTKLSTPVSRIKEENHYDTIPTDEERAARLNNVYSPPPYDQASKSSDLHFLRNVSYRQAQQSTPPLTQRRPTNSSLSHSHSNTNDDSSHYSEIIQDTAPSGVINRSYSHTGSIQSSSNHSIKQASKRSSQDALKEEEQQTEESTVETDQEEESEEEAGEDENVDEGDEQEEEEEEEEEEEDDDDDDDDQEHQPLGKPLPGKQIVIDNISTAYSTLAHMVDPKEARKLEKIRKRKQARFRWFLAYTILNNYHLFDLRKQAQNRLALLRIQRSNLMDEQQQQPAQVAADIPTSQSVPTIIAPEIAQRRIQVTTPTPEIRPQAINRLLSVPSAVVPVADNFPQSPAERYIAVRSCMLYDVTAQQPTTSRSNASSIITQAAKSDFAPKARSSQLPTVTIQPPSSTSGSELRIKRPSYQRQASLDPTHIITSQNNGTPIFQPVPESNHSTADYPITAGSSVGNLSTLRTQMSHAQHMQAWRQQQLRRAHKKHPHCYVYGPPPQRPLEEKVATATILTPQVIEPVSSGIQRLPSRSPYRFPLEVNPNGEKSKATSTVNKTKQEKSVQKKSLRTSSALVNRRESQGSLSNVTEV